jgi:hypothetical protein
MPLPSRRNLPSAQDIPWSELRRRSVIVYVWLQAGWSVLTPAEREHVRKLLVKSRGRPNRLTREEARVLGRLAGRAASAAAAAHRKH